jgi:ribose transport system substrate-binding protein
MIFDLIKRTAQRGHKLAGAFASVGLIGAAASLSPAVWNPAYAAAPLTIGLVNFDASALPANILAEGVRAKAKEAGWDVIVQDPKADLGQANAICTQYVTRKVDAIIVHVFQVSQMAQCLAYAKDASIPVYFMGSTLQEGVAGTVSLAVASGVNKDFLTFAATVPDLSVLAFTYRPGAPCLIREQDLDSQIASGKLTLQVNKEEIRVPGIVTNALASTQSWLNGHPADQKENLAIWACTSDAAFGALTALKQVERAGIPIYTFDMNEQIVDSLRAGEITETLWIDPKGVGSQLVKQIQDHIAGGAPREDEAAHLAITKDNLEAFLKEHPDLN